MWWIEAIGITATVFILISMSVNTSSWKGDVWMRAINIIGSIVFVIYGALLPAISTAILNGLLVFINTYYLIKLIKEKKVEEVKTETSNEPKTDNASKTENKD